MEWLVISFRLPGIKLSSVMSIMIGRFFLKDSITQLFLLLLKLNMFRVWNSWGLY